MTELKGRHKISLGSSITNPSTTSLHALKYNFQPSTIDHSRPSTLSGDSGQDYTLTVPSKDGTSHFFKGPQTAGKDIDCLLIYDEREGSYVLERVGSTLRMDHQRHVAHPGHQVTEQTSIKKEDGRPDPVIVQDSTTTDGPEETASETGNDHVVDDEDDDDLDDFANMLESTLDESSHKPPASVVVPAKEEESGRLHMPIAKRPANIVRMASRETESSEDED